MTHVSLVIPPRERDLGDGMSVRRALPHPRRRLVGPFIFWDHFGPVEVDPFEMIVRPHPHIGLSTLTWMFSGKILHRDSLGNELFVEAGEVNWMTAGRGISHSERAAARWGGAGQRLEGIQLWVALPKAHEEDPPAFDHFGADAIPVVSHGGATWRLVAGTFDGARSPVPVRSPTFLLDAHVDGDVRFTAPAGQEAALYVARGAIELEGSRYGEGTMVVLTAGADVSVRAEAAHLLALGGAPIDGERHIWWNFVHSDPARIEAAKAAWREGGFGQVPNETDRIPLPAS